MPELSLRRVATISVLGAIVVGFLPPSVSQWRSPPPEPLVLMVWMRFSTGLALLVFDALFLFRYRKERGFDKALILISLFTTLFFTIGVLHWVFDFPAKFTWRIIKMDYLGG